MRIVHAAIDAGINFLDNAWEYITEGESERRMGRAIADRRDAVFLMTKVCTHGRDASVAMRQLEQSLRRLRTDAALDGRFELYKTSAEHEGTSAAGNTGSRLRRRWPGD